MQEHSAESRQRSCGAETTPCDVSAGDTSQQHQVMQLYRAARVRRAARAQRNRCRANGGAALVLGAGSPARAAMRKPLTQVPTTPYLALSPPAHPRHTLHALPCPRHTHTHSPTHNRPHAPTPAWLMHMPCTHAQTRAASTHKLYAARRSSSSERGRRGGVGAWPGGHHCWPVGL